MIFASKLRNISNSIRKSEGLSDQTTLTEKKNNGKRKIFVRST